MLEKNDSNISARHVRKIGSGRPKQIKDMEVIAEINRILKIEEVQKQNFYMCYSLLSLRELTSKINDAGLVISHVSVRTLLKAQGFFIYGLSESIKGNPNALEFYIKYIHLDISCFHKSRSPVVFIDIKRMIYKKSNDINNVDTALEDALLEWWHELGSKKYPKSSEILIFAKGGSLKANKQAFQKFANESKLKTTFWHIPAKIIKWFNIESENFNENICIKQKHKKICYNASIYLIPHSKGIPTSFPIMLASMDDPDMAKKIAYISPPEWYYTLEPSKENKT